MFGCLLCHSSRVNGANANNLNMKTILFVEDEMALQKTFKDVLEEEGYEIITALDGEVGLKLTKEKKPDLILLDLILPKLDGFEFLEKMKADPEIKNIPVIILTNLERAEDIERALELGATTYLVKANYSLKEVIEKVRKILESR